MCVSVCVEKGGRDRYVSRQKTETAEDGRFEEDVRGDMRVEGSATRFLKLRRGVGYG